MGHEEECSSFELDDEVILQGQIMIEIHSDYLVEFHKGVKKLPKLSSHPWYTSEEFFQVARDENPSMIGRFYLHTSFLELHQTDSGAHESDHKVVLVLRGEDMDKGAGAPLKRTYPYLEIRLEFEIPYVMDLELDNTISKELEEKPDEMEEKCSLAWISWTVEQIWPAMRNSMTDALTPIIRDSFLDTLPSVLADRLHVEELDLGRVAPTF